MKKRFEFGSPDYRQGAHYSIIDNETNREMLSQNEIMNKLNELAYEKYMLEKENEQLKNRLDENAQLQKETLQKHFDFADKQAKKNVDNAMIHKVYDLLRCTIRGIADELRVDLE